MSAWVASLLKAIGVTLIKDVCFAIYNGLKEKLQKKKNEETAKEIENEKNPEVIRGSIDNLP